jgi:hypothetical protein
VSKNSNRLKKAIETFQSTKKRQTTFAHPISWPDHKSQKQYQQRHSAMGRVLSLALSLTPDFCRARADAGQKQAILFLAAHKAARNCGERESLRLA